MWGCGAALSTSRAVHVRIVLVLGTPHSQLHGLQLQLSCNQSSTIECIALLRLPIFYKYNIGSYAWLHPAAICVFSSESVTFLTSFHSLWKCILSRHLYFSVHILSRFQVRMSVCLVNVSTVCFCMCSVQTCQSTPTRYWTHIVSSVAPRSWTYTASSKRDPLSTLNLRATPLCFPSQVLT